VGIRPEHALDLALLARGQVLARVEAEAPGEQALPPQHLVEPRDAAAKAVRGVEERSVGVRDLVAEREQLPRAFAAAATAGLDGLEEQDRAPRPDRPLAEEAPRERDARRRAEREVGEEVGHDRVVVARVERDLAHPSALRQRAHYVDRLIAAE